LLKNYYGFITDYIMNRKREIFKMKFLITFREIFMSKTMELATISTQRGFTNGAG